MHCCQFLFMAAVCSHNYFFSGFFLNVHISQHEVVFKNIGVFPV